MAWQTNDGEPTYGRDMGDKAQETEIRPLHHFSDAAAGQLSPEGDETSACADSSCRGRQPYR